MHALYHTALRCVCFVVYIRYVLSIHPFRPVRQLYITDILDLVHWAQHVIQATYLDYVQ